MPSFSPQLIERLQQHCRNRFKREITVEQANQYLHSYAELFGLFVADDDPPPDQSAPP